MQLLVVASSTRILQLHGLGQIVYIIAAMGTNDCQLCCIIKVQIKGHKKDPQVNESFLLMQGLIFSYFQMLQLMGLVCLVVNFLSAHIDSTFGKFAVICVACKKGKVGGGR